MNNPLYIDLGTNINPLWTNVISVSNDGVNWDNVSLIGLGVSGHILKGNIDSLLITKPLDVHVLISKNNIEVLHISLCKLVNQPTWSNDSIGLNQALTDIKTWIETLDDNATEDTLESIRVLTESLEAKDFSTEATLAFIKDNSDKFNFTGGKLDVNANVVIPNTLAKESKQDIQIANQLSNSVFGDTSNVSTIALTDISATILTADIDRKQVYILNTTNKTVWVYYGTPAVFGKGIELIRGQFIVEDKYRGVITAIMNTGDVGNIEVTSILL